jgi:hypothetical protein
LTGGDVRLMLQGTHRMICCRPPELTKKLQQLKMADSAESPQHALNQPAESGPAHGSSPASSSAGTDNLPFVDVSPPLRRSRFRFSILFVLLFTTILAVMFAVGRLPKETDDNRYPSVTITKKGMFVRETVYQVRFGTRDWERYESTWEGGVEKLARVHVQDFYRARSYGPDPYQREWSLTAGHQQAFDAVRTLVRSKVDFEGMSWADERPTAGSPAASHAPFMAIIYPEVAPPRAESFNSEPSGSSTATTHGS